MRSLQSIPLNDTKKSEVYFSWTTLPKFAKSADFLVYLSFPLPVIVTETCLYTLGICNKTAVPRGHHLLPIPPTNRPAVVQECYSSPKPAHPNPMQQDTCEGSTSRGAATKNKNRHNNNHPDDDGSSTQSPALAPKGW